MHGWRHLLWWRRLLWRTGLLLAGRLRDPAFGNVWHLGLVWRGRWGGAPVRIQPRIWTLCAVWNPTVLCSSGGLLGLLLQGKLGRHFSCCARHLCQRWHIRIKAGLGKCLASR